MTVKNRKAKEVMSFELQGEVLVIRLPLGLNRQAPKMVLDGSSGGWVETGLEYDGNDLRAMILAGHYPR